MRRLSIAVVLAAALLSACNTIAPVQNVENATVFTAAGKPLTAEQVHSAILRAGTQLGWTFKEAGPGKMLAMLTLRTHTAEIEIPYSVTSYSLLYKSSIDLMAKDGKIHRNYNGWITNLNRGIATQLSLI